MKTLFRAFAVSALFGLTGLMLSCKSPEMTSSDEGMAFASDIRLSNKERVAESVLDSLRTGLLADKGRDWGLFSDYLDYRDAIDDGVLYKLMTEMPKGGLLHLHAGATGDVDWLIDKVLSMPDCYVCWEKGSESGVKGELRFFNGVPIPAGWRNVQRLNATDPTFKQSLRQLLTIGNEDDRVGNIWVEFEAMFTRTDFIASYRPVFVDYLVYSLTEMAKDGVQFVEVRTSCISLNNPDGTTSSDGAVADVWQSIEDSVKADYPDFELHLIISNWKGGSLAEIADDVRRTNALKTSHPDLISGYDLVGEEDALKSNGFYAAALKLAEVPLFLHGGESLSPQNTNIQDAVDLGTKRVGHGLNLFYFPSLEADIVKKGTALEVCPLSNQILRYVPDLRLHPALRYMQNGVQITLSSDDPMLFQTKAMTDDFFAAYLAWNLDLKALKKLLLNSITYSALDTDAKQHQLTLFNGCWEAFVDKVSVRQF